MAELALVVIRHCYDRYLVLRVIREPIAQVRREDCLMSAAKNVLVEHENRVAAITAIAIEAKALFFGSPDETESAADPNAEKAVYAKAFQAWAEGRIEGTAEDIFETVQEVLEA